LGKDGITGLPFPSCLSQAEKEKKHMKNIFRKVEERLKTVIRDKIF
jgi:hypothetical protein